MTNEKRVPELRFPEFSGEWENKRLKDITKINQGLQIPIAERKLDFKEGYYFYITNEFLKSNSKHRYYIENPPLSVIVKKDDILMTRTGNTGKVITNVEGAFHNNFFKVNYDKDKISKLFLYEMLKSPKINNQFLRLAGASTIPDLNHSDFYRVKINIPNIYEQQKIGEFFSKLDRQIELEEKKMALLEEQKKGYMQKIFSQELRFKDENGEDYPEWEDYKLQDIGYTYSGLSGKTKENFGKGDSYFITYVNIFNNIFTKENDIEKVEVSSKEKQNNVVKNDIFFTTSSETPYEVGMASIWKYDYEKLYLNSFSFGYRIDDERINPDFIVISLRNEEMRKKIIKLAQGSTRFNISKTKLMNEIIKIPSLFEQNKIVSFYLKINYLIEVQESKIYNLKVRKDGLLSQLIL